MIGSSLLSLGKPYSDISPIVTNTKVKLIGYSARTIDVHAHVDKKGALIIQYNLCVDCLTPVEGERTYRGTIKALDKDLKKELTKEIDKSGKINSYKLQRFKVLIYK